MFTGTENREDIYVAIKVIKKYECNDKSISIFTSLIDEAVVQSSQGGLALVHASFDLKNSSKLKCEAGSSTS